MKRVIYPLTFIGQSNQILHPDNIELFSNSIIVGNNVISDYSGNMNFTQFIKPPKVKVTINTIMAKNEGDESFIVYNPAIKTLYAQLDTPFVVTGTIENFPINDTWNTPILRNGVVDAFFLSQNNGGIFTMQGRFPSAGLWEIKESVINSAFPEELHFSFTELIAKVYSKL